METKTPKVTGIGGIFFKTNDKTATMDWYQKHLGFDVTDFGTMFNFRNLDRPDEVNYLVWSPFAPNSEYFAPSEKEFMINYMVQNIEALVENLAKSGVTVLDEIATYEYGKFVHIMDNDGNKIELWEPAE